MATYIKHNTSDTSYISHHGIKGMHWGVRNGPPYPLSSKQKSASERKGTPSKGTPSKGAVVKKAVKNYAKTYVNTALHPVQAAKAIVKHPLKSSAELQLMKDLTDNNKTGGIFSKGSENKEKKLHNQTLYKKLQRNSDLSLYKNDPVITSITNDERYKKALQKFRSTPYDGPDEEYDPFEDPKVIEKSEKIFKKQTGHEYDPESYQDYKTLEYIMDDICNSEGYYEKADKINASPNWDKAYSEYSSTKSDLLDEYLGDYSNKPLKTDKNYINTYRQAVYEILNDLDLERQ